MYGPRYGELVDLERADLTKAFDDEMETSNQLILQHLSSYQRVYII